MEESREIRMKMVEIVLNYLEDNQKPTQISKVLGISRSIVFKYFLKYSEGKGTKK